MSGTSKVVDEILLAFKNELENETTIPDDFKSALEKVVTDKGKVTSAKLEKVLYPEDDL